ncbi:MAG: hypothetical protein JW973_03445 [Bacteroidales bacterium]|nr:hypothetical protein [Bacteroidales bacterium]
MKTPIFKSTLLLFGLTLYLVFACTEKYDFEKFSGMIEYDPEIDAPVVWGSLTAEDLFVRWDSLMDNHGDTVVFVFRDDSLFYINASDFSDIPPQDTSEFNLISAISYPVLPFDSIFIDSTETYRLTLEHNMRIDSIFINDGFLLIEVSSSFRHAGMLTIDCNEIFVDGQSFHKTIPISSSDGSFYRRNLYPLQNARIYVDNSVPGEGSIHNIYHLVLYRNPSQGITEGDRVRINFSIIDLDKYEAVFGFAGNDFYEEDTTVVFGFENMQEVTGNFSITDPRIRITYINSFGLPVGLDLAIWGYFGDGPTILVDPPVQIVEASDNYLQPEVHGSVQYNKNNVPNIDELLTYPLPDSLITEGEANANPGASDARNFVLKNSNLQVGIDLEVPLAFKADLQLRDTIKLDVDKPEAIEYVEYANLHYRIRNEFPVNLHPYIILYDSIADINLDTIFFTESPADTVFFIPAAPVDENGVTITSQVNEVTGVIRLDEALIDHFFMDANKIIMVGSFSSYQTNNVVILTTYKFDFKFNLEAKIRYTGNLNDTESNN